MNGILKKIAVAFLSLALMTPMVDAQNHRTSGNRGGNHTATQHPSNNGASSRPNSSRPSARPVSGNNGSHNNSGNHGNYRPGNNGNHGNSNRPNNNNRPGNNGNHGNSNRPGNNGNHGNSNRPNNNNRPGNNGNHGNGNHKPDYNRPGNNGNHGNNNHRPGNNEWHFGRPNGGGGHHHGHVTPPRPGHNHRPPMIAPPMRPHRPIAHRWTRPVPPPAWRPRPHAPSISAILGISFGTTLGLSLDYLYGRGYVVDGYGDNRVYLRDVNQFNYYWPDATLYYGNGGLTRSEFLYSTSYPDMIRYNALYNSLTGTYGAPVNYVTSGASVTATWFAPNSGYVTLQYAPQYSVGGALRYFTIITFGL